MPTKPANLRKKSVVFRGKNHDIIDIEYTLSLSTCAL